MAGTPFTRLSKTSVQVEVNAKSSLWFAWAPNGYHGPYQEVGDIYRPIALPLSQIGSPGLVDIAVAPGSITRKWRHGPNDNQASDADGRFDAAGNPVAEATQVAYDSDIFNSRGIRSTSHSLNILIAMFGPAPDSPPPADTIDMLDVGLSETGLATGGAEWLYLGMHDGYEWDNNSNDAAGPMVVIVSASVKAAGK